MFSIPADNSLSGWYRTQVIHFGASLSEFVEDEWEEWLLKLESLLRNLFWQMVFLHLITELQGSYNYTWEADKDAFVNMYENPPRPVTKWNFEGGPRSLNWPGFWTPTPTSSASPTVNQDELELIANFDEYGKYEKMREAGATPQAIYLSAKANGISNTILLIRILSTVFQMSLNEARQVIANVDDSSETLDDI